MPRIPWKRRIMEYFILFQGGFEADIASKMGRKQEDLTKVYGGLNRAGYIYRVLDPPIRIKKRVYWRITDKLPVLYKIYNDRAFKELKDEMQAQPWITHLAMKKINDFPRNITVLFNRVIKSSPSFFEVMLHHETLDQLKNRYPANYNAAKTLGITDTTLINSWFIFLICGQCCDTDEERGNESEDFREILNQLWGTLEVGEPQEQQAPYMQHLESVISAIELTLPNWDKEFHKPLKRDMIRNIAEFRLACAKERALPSFGHNKDSMNSEYAMSYHKIIFDLIDERDGPPLF